MVSVAAFSHRVTLDPRTTVETCLFAIERRYPAHYPTLTSRLLQDAGPLAREVRKAMAGIYLVKDVSLDRVASHAIYDAVVAAVNAGSAGTAPNFILLDREQSIEMIKVMCEWRKEGMNHNPTDVIFFQRWLLDGLLSENGTLTSELVASSTGLMRDHVERVLPGAVNAWLKGAREEAQIVRDECLLLGESFHRLESQVLVLEKTIEEKEKDVSAAKVSAMAIEMLIGVCLVCVVVLILLCVGCIYTAYGAD